MTSRPAAPPEPGIFERLPIQEALMETARSGYRRALGPFDLTSLGVAAIIGAGIFVFLGKIARDPTGPAVVVSLIVAGIAAVLAALVYAELASLIPGSGSAYTYAYAALGRLPAFMMGWIILNSYAIGDATVAIGWSEFFVKGLNQLGGGMPDALTRPPGAGGLLNLPAGVVMLLVTLLCLPKIRESSRVNNALVALKIAIVLFVIILGAFLIRPGNYVPFSPGGTAGILTGSAVLFFAYLGFDVVSATAEEAKNPRRDIPVAIVASVTISMVLYLLMALVLTGTVRSSELDAQAPVAAAFEVRGFPWAAGLITIGALVAMATVLYGFQVALSRILQAMARDGFLPTRLARLHPTTGTPWALNILSGLFTVACAMFLDFRTVGDMAVLAALAIYVLVSVGVLVLKVKAPNARRGFRTHWMVPVAAILLMVGIAVTGLGVIIHLAFLAWLAVGLMLYGFWGHRSVSRIRAARAG